MHENAYYMLTRHRCTRSLGGCKPANRKVQPCELGKIRMWKYVGTVRRIESFGESALNPDWIIAFGGFVHLPGTRVSEGFGYFCCPYLYIRVLHPTLFDMKRHETTPNITKRHSPFEVGVCSPVQFVWNWIFSKRTHKCNRPNGARNLGLTTSAKTTPRLKKNFATRNGLRTKGRISDQWTVKTREKHKQIRCSNVSIGVGFHLRDSDQELPSRPGSFQNPCTGGSCIAWNALKCMKRIEMDWLKLQMTWYISVFTKILRLSSKTKAKGVTYVKSSNSCSKILMPVGTAENCIVQAVLRLRRSWW